MAFTYTVRRRENKGAEWEITGTFDQLTGDTGGDIVTGLAKVTDFRVQPCSDTVISDQCVANETFPLDSGTVTIVTPTGAKHGTWEAKGHY